MQNPKRDYLGWSCSARLITGSSQKADQGNWIFVAWWLQVVEAQQVRPITIGDYANRNRRPILAYLDEKKLDELEPRGSPTATVSGGRQILSTAMKAAEEFGHVTKNPVIHVRRWRSAPKETT